MKKSKILIPAFAVLALSVGASVTGTVAWFTAAKTANVTMSNVAAINVAGNLGVTLGSEVNGGAIVSGQAATLTPLLDASFDGTDRYVSTTATDVDGKTINITGLRKLATTEYKKTLTVKKGETTESVDAYFLNQFNMTFTTSSQENMYLLFSPTKSKLSDPTKTESSDYKRTQKNIYNALRVMLEIGSKKIIWAPYTYEEKLFTAYFTGNTANVKTPFSADAQFDSLKYVDADDASLVKDWDASKINTEEKDFTEISSKAVVDASKSLLSSTLSATTSAKVKCSIWFEGLDRDCLAGSTDVQDTTKEITGKVLNMAFYALPISGFAA